MKRLYVIHYGYAGYLPTNSVFFTNKREALSYMSSELKELRTSGEKWSGSARIGYAETSRSEYMEFDEVWVEKTEVSMYLEGA